MAREPFDQDKALDLFRRTNELLAKYPDAGPAQAREAGVPLLDLVHAKRAAKKRAEAANGTKPPAPAWAGMPPIDEHRMPDDKLANRTKGSMTFAERTAAVEAAEQAETAQEPEKRTIVAMPAAGITMKAPKWLYDRRIPAGAITLLGGREGIGKSTIGFDLLARTTRGELPGQYHKIPKSVGVVASEDSWESVILPRLVAARADLGRVYRIEARTEEERLETISAPADLGRLASVCTECDIALIMLDPIMSVIHSSLDTHKDREVRQALDPLARFASETHVSVLGLIHVNKSNSTDPLNSLMASRAFSAVARSVLYCLADPEAEDLYLFGHPKSNLGPKQPTLRYHLVEHKIALNEEDPLGEAITTSRVSWDGEDGRSIQEAMEEPRPERATGELATRIEGWIAKQGRTVSAKELAAEFSDVKRVTLDQNLGRMVKRGKIVRPIHGHYAMPHSSDTRSDTPLETSEVSEVSETSDDLGNLTVLTHLTLLEAQGQVSERVSEATPSTMCAVCDRPLFTQMIAAGRTTHPSCGGRAEVGRSTREPAARSLAAGYDVDTFGVAHDGGELHQCATPGCFRPASDLLCDRCTIPATT